MLLGRIIALSTQEITLRKTKDKKESSLIMINMVLAIKWLKALNYPELFLIKI